MMNKKIKKILKFASIGVLLMISAVGVLLKGDKISLNRTSNQNHGNNLSESKATEAQEPKAVCRGALNEDGNALALKEYTKTEIVDCSSIGCGGIF